jgi:NAD+ kinase
MNIGIVGNLERHRAMETVAEVVRAVDTHLPQSRISILEELSGGAAHVEHRCKTADEVVADSDILFSVGGDGTMLEAARAILRTKPEVGLLGVNVGKLGFLSENPPSEIDALVAELASQRLIEEHRMILTAALGSVSSESIKLRRASHPATSPDRLLALNEIVIDNYASTRMLTFRVRVDGYVLGVFRADGFIVATPTGSTGYAVSAGGPIIVPTSPVMLLTAIAPHSLNVRPVIIPEASVVEVEAGSDETKQALVVADGQEEAIADTPITVTIRPHTTKLKLLRRRERSYFDLLRTKLYWNIDQRESGAFDPRRT